MDEAEHERVQRLYAALSRGDPAEIADFCHADVELQLGMARVDWQPATYQGHTGIGEFFAELQEAWDEVIVRSAMSAC